MRVKTRLKLIVFFFIIPLLIGTAIGGYLALARGVPSVEELKQYKDIPSTKVYADDDTLIGEIKLEKGIFVPIKKMPGHLINAVVAVEDAHFWQHSGIDYLAILRAALKDLLHRQIKEGGSTITQQLAKMTFLTPEKTIRRKLREVALAVKIESTLSKEEILELYLNRAYFGHGAYGAEMASRVYFGKSVRDITLPEAALIVGILKAPSNYSPFNNRTRARERQLYVISRMEEEGYITRGERETSEKIPVRLSEKTNSESAYNYFVDYIKKLIEAKYDANAIYKSGMRIYTTLDRKAQIEAQIALEEGLRDIDKRRGWRGVVEHRDIVPKNNEPQIKKQGINKLMVKIFGANTTSKENTSSGFKTDEPQVGSILEGIVVSVNKNEAVVDMAFSSGMLSLTDALWASNTLIDGKKKTIQNFDLTKILKPGDVVMVKVKSAKANIVKLMLEQEPEVQGAVVSIDPHTGYIKALVGGSCYTKAEFNRAVYGKRQVGSAFKPIVYSVALENGYTPASFIMDEELTYKSGSKEWNPKNYDGEFYGSITLREALAYSRNVVTIKLAEAIGLGKILNFSRDLGIKDSDLPKDLTLALGSLSISPLELTSAYSTFANSGMKMNPIAIKYITDLQGRVIESTEPNGTEALSPQTAFLITSMLKDVVNYGTGVGAKALGRPVAGKTGTTNDFRDAWFLGYTPDILTGVWIGFDDMRPIGNKETGARAALPVWLRFMRSVTGDYEIRDFEMPDGIVSRFVDINTGQIVNAPGEESQIEFFKDDSVTNVPESENSSSLANVPSSQAKSP
ncbi:MAG: PBP1A family penicillin-binding protein [Nitrospirae bacterium]|nr:PBP1A family penicillin-binding protein [Nitrospirota bacterium]